MNFRVDPGRQAMILWSALHGMIQFKKLEKTILAEENHQSLYLEAVERFLERLRKRQYSGIYKASESFIIFSR